jgi:cytochrome c553
MKLLLPTVYLLLALVRTFAAPAPQVVFTFDARPLQKLDLSQPANVRRVWDTLHVLSALQGLANRVAPRFYLFYCAEFGTDTDPFWFDWFRGECMACHTTDGYRPMKRLLAGRDRDAIGNLLGMLHDCKPDSPYHAFMPPQVGTKEEIVALGDFLATLSPPAAAADNAPAKPALARR